MVSNEGQRGATGGVNGGQDQSLLRSVHFPQYTTHLHTRKHYNGCHHLQPISHLRGAMLKDVRLNRRHVRVDLVGRAKLVRGLVRRKKEEGRRKKEEGRREKGKGKREK